VTKILSSGEKQNSSTYKYGFVSDVETEIAPKGLSEETVRTISAKKNEPKWLLERRLDAFTKWKEMKEPDWAKISYPPIDYQAYAYMRHLKRKKKKRILAKLILRCLKHMTDSAFLCGSKRGLRALLRA